MIADDDIFKVYEACRRKAAASGVEALSGVERVVELVERFEFEVALGGLATFFHNSASAYVLEIIESLGTIGANSCADVLASAYDLLRPVALRGPYSGFAEWSRLVEQDAFAHFDDQVWAAGSLRPLLASYVNAHAAELTHLLDGGADGA